MADRQDLAAQLARWRLTRDDTGPRRIYRDAQGRAYDSVTQILSATSANPWKPTEPGSYGEKVLNAAAQRGTRAHKTVEYLLKTARRLLTHSANRRKLWRIHPQHGLWHVPTPLTRWALDKAYKNLPPTPFYAAACAEGLVAWAMENVTAIYLIEFSVCYWSENYGHGFAGTADGLLDINGVGPSIIDWKTTSKPLTPEILTNYTAQAGGYSAGLEAMIGLKPAGAHIIAVQPTGFVTPHHVSDTDTAKLAFLRRFETFCEVRPV